MTRYESIVVLTGAGISAESGIRTFRDQNGLWEDHPIEDVASPAGFARNPRLVLDFYNQRRQQMLSDEVKPNAAHFALGKLEREFEGNVLVVTQNIDDLHERGGSRNLIHMHGELLKMRCAASGAIRDIQGDITVDTVCDCCQAAGRLRPHIVWFGEVPMEMDRIEKSILGCDLFVSVGTSGNVYPAAGFVQLANHVGAKTIELNLEPGQQQSAFQQSAYGKATKLIPAFVAQILGDGN